MEELRGDLKKDPVAVAKLGKAEARWEALRRDYHEDRFTCHPEEMLESIYNAKEKAGSARGPRGTSSPGVLPG